eukprot:TRINITY_DN7299_c0_g1_i1.p1 TRINITY_DN7299_c0_g1~~TRINITY_DN7299_c0_g1_i1.p1  ORF type:complete len:316 (+),score=44.90 TRINITY_DN7299_c0_g1_i1:32-949(+)
MVDKRRYVTPPAAKVKVVVLAEGVTEDVEEKKVKKIGRYMAQTASSRAKTPPPVRKEKGERKVGGGGGCAVGGIKSTASWEKKTNKEVVDTTWAARDFYPPPGPSVVEERRKTQPPQKAKTVMETEPEPESHSPQPVSPPKPRTPRANSKIRSLTPREKYIRETQWVSPTDRHTPPGPQTTAVRDFEEWLQRKGEAVAAGFEEMHQHLEAERKAQEVIRKHMKQDMVEQRKIESKLQRETDYLRRYNAVQASRSPSHTRAPSVPSPHSTVVYESPQFAQPRAPYLPHSTTPPRLDGDSALSPPRR